MNLPSGLHDAHGRSVSYLRLSVTDRCNFRCLYCVPQVQGLNFIPHDSILSYEEFLRLVRVAVTLGVQKVRLTGGEPFARLGFIDFVRLLRAEFPQLVLGITTNASLLREHIPALVELKINALNISLDSFVRSTFQKITNTDLLPVVKAAIQEAVTAGLPVKVNAVALKGINNLELPQFLEFASEHAVDFRFIEYMPLGGRGHWSDEKFWSADDIIKAAMQHAVLIPQDINGAGNLNGPAKMYSIQGGKGRFGVITPVSQHFCASCNRLRVTSDGRLRTCLFSDVEYHLRSILRHPGLSDTTLYKIFCAANQRKPLGTELLAARENRQAVIRRAMSSIGG